MKPSDVEKRTRSVTDFATLDAARGTALRAKWDAALHAAWVATRGATWDATNAATSVMTRRRWRLR